MISNVRNPRFANAGATAIWLTVDLEGHGTQQFLATPTDPEQHGRELYLAAAAGDFGAIADYVPTPPPPGAIPWSLPLWRVRAALRDLDKLDVATAAIAALGDPGKAELWASNDSIARTSQTLIAAAAAAGIDPQDLFAAGAAITL